MKKYIIENIGCDDTTTGVFELTEEQYEFLNNLFEELNKNSESCCMPEIFIEELKGDIDEQRRHYYFDKRSN